MISFFSIYLLLLISGAAKGVDIQAEKGWKAGLSRVIITPSEPMWMAGYGSREHPSDGVLTELWAKALVLEDSAGKRILLITTDLLGIPKKMSEHIRDRIGKKYALSRSQIILSSSHTHTGPVLTGALYDIYPLDDKQLAVINKYSDELEDKIVGLAGDALEAMVPARIFSQNGVTRFQVNRRNNNESTLYQQTELKGPNDYAVPVLKVADLSGKIIAIAFGYACHATVLSTYRFSGDYPGFAQLELEKEYPGCMAMFFQGAGADQNPLPRRTIPLAIQYGKELASAVSRVLDEEMKELDPVISFAYSEIDLPFSEPPSKEELLKARKEKTGYEHRWAASQLEALRKYGSLPESYPYPVQVWNLGSQALVALGGEVVVQYSIELKKLFGPEIFVMAYANDDMAYIPSETILKEGGYEGESSLMVYGLPSKWAAGIEEKIIGMVKELAVKAEVKQVAP